MRITVVALVMLGLTPTPALAQSLMDAAAAAAKAKAESTLVWIAPRTTVATAVEPVTTTPAVTPIAATSSATLGEASPAGPTDALAKNRAAGAALLGARLVAVRQLLTKRTQTTAQYQEACAGKETSAGWKLRGEEITTPNAQTPVCLTLASDLENQTGTYTRERAAITETARTGGILPGVLRDLLTSHALPD